MGLEEARAAFAAPFLSGQSALTLGHGSQWDSVAEEAEDSAGLVPSNNRLGKQANPPKTTSLIHFKGTPVYKLLAVAKDLFVSSAFSEGRFFLNSMDSKNLPECIRHINEALLTASKDSQVSKYPHPRRLCL